MKKYVYFLILFILITFIFSKLGRNEQIITTFDDNGFNSYVINFKNGITINDYKKIFSELNENNYIIKNYELENNFHEKLNKDISSITINKGNYLDTLDEYLKKYIDILYIYNKELEISGIYLGSTRIIKIYLNCTKDIYNELMNLNV